VKGNFTVYMLIYLKKKPHHSVSELMNLLVLLEPEGTGTP